MKSALLALVLVVASIHAQQSQQTTADAQAQKRVEERDRQAQLAKMAGSDPLNLAKIPPPQFLTPCQVMKRDDTIDTRNIPLAEWLAAGEATQIPWKVQIAKPALNMEQRRQISYEARVDSTDLGWKAGPHELQFVSGISSPDGKWLVDPKAGRQIFGSMPSGPLRVFFRDCLHVRPGDYVLWMALHDPQSAKHNVVRRRVHVSDTEDDPLPNLNSTLPVARFPEPNPAPSLFPPLPVMNKQPLNVDLLAVVSPADQWPTRTDILTWTNSQVLGAMSVLSQMKLAHGSLSAFSLDLPGQAIKFEQRDFVYLDRQGLSQSFYKPKDVFTQKIEVLETFKSRSAFFRKVVSDRVNAPGDSQRVVILVSGSLLFERGSDLAPLRLERDCRCRVYHIHLRLNKDDVFDHAERLIKPLGPQTFDVTSATDFRKALAKIVRDLESF